MSYQVIPFSTGFFSGTIDPKKLEVAINRHANKGWRFVRSIHETRRVLFLFRREAHFLVFEHKESGTESEHLENLVAQATATNTLLRQLLKSYGHEPEV